MNYADSDLIPSDMHGQFPSGIFTEVIPLPEFEMPEGIYRFYKALRYGRWHLLKALRPERATEPLYRQLLFKEFEIGYRLSHPNIVQTLGLEEVTGVGQAIVLEYIDGLSLREVMDAGTMTTAQFRKVLSQICSALSYLHSLQIIHRDIKPENILVTRNGGNVKLIDFSLSDADSYAVLKGAAGTRRYAAPELLRSEPVDARTDVYALGVMMREAGRFPRLARRCQRMNPAERPSIQEIAEQMRTGHSARTVIAITILGLFSLFAGLFWLSEPPRGSMTSFRDTIVRRDTLSRLDTLFVIRQDTVYRVRRDTVVSGLSEFVIRPDTVYRVRRDTVVSGLSEAEIERRVNERINQLRNEIRHETWDKYENPNRQDVGRRLDEESGLL